MHLSQPKFLYFHVVFFLEILDLLLQRVIIWCSYWHNVMLTFFLLHPKVGPSSHLSMQIFTFGNANIYILSLYGTEKPSGTTKTSWNRNRNPVSEAARKNSSTCSHLLLFMYAAKLTIGSNIIFPIHGVY